MRRYEPLLYRVNSAVIVDEQGDRHVVYGVDAVNGRKIIISVKNIFCERHRAEKLADDCNRFGVDVVHLIDIICDMLE